MSLFCKFSTSVALANIDVSISFEPKCKPAGKQCILYVLASWVTRHALEEKSQGEQMKTRYGTVSYMCRWVGRQGR